MKRQWLLVGNEMHDVHLETSKDVVKTLVLHSGEFTAFELTVEYPGGIPEVGPAITVEDLPAL